MFSFGGSTSKSKIESSSFDRSNSSSVSGGVSASQSNQAIAFEDVFARLFGGAEGAAAALDPSMLTEAANTLFSSGTGFLGSLGGDVGTSYLQDRVTGDNPLLQQQIDALGADLGDFFNEQINPAITSEAVAGGTLGGGRQGVAQGMAADALGEQFMQGALNLRAGDIAARDQAAGILADQNIAAAGTGIGGLGALAGIADFGFGANLAPYERLAQILGGPTTLTSASSSSADFARALAESYGESSATSTSKSKSLGMGF